MEQSTQKLFDGIDTANLKPYQAPAVSIEDKGIWDRDFSNYRQIIADFKAAQRIAGDIPVGIVGVTLSLWAVTAIRCLLKY